MRHRVSSALALLLAASILPACSGGAQSATSSASAGSEATSAAATSSSASSEASGAGAASASSETTGTTASAQPAGVDDENYDTGDASLDNPRNEDGIGQDELMVVSFGTSYNDSRRQTIGAIEQALEDAFPAWSVRRGFTSQIIIDHVKSRDKEVIDNVDEAIKRASKNGVKRLVVQPTHLMNGYEYADLEKELAKNSDAFEKVALGKPLLTSDEDFTKVAQAIIDFTAEYDDGNTAIVFMGHGTEADSNKVYSTMQAELAKLGKEHYYVGTVEASPSVDDVLAEVKKGNYKRVVLEPLMIVAGDHANNDMAGDEKDSWKSKFSAEGYEVKCILTGLGELKPIQELFVEHAQAAIDSLGQPASE